MQPVVNLLLCARTAMMGVSGSGAPPRSPRGIAAWAEPCSSPVVDVHAAQGHTCCQTHVLRGR